MTAHDALSSSGVVVQARREGNGRTPSQPRHLSNHSRDGGARGAVGSTSRRHAFVTYLCLAGQGRLQLAHVRLLFRLSAATEAKCNVGIVQVQAGIYPRLFSLGSCFRARRRSCLLAGAHCFLCVEAQRLVAVRPRLLARLMAAPCNDNVGEGLRWLFSSSLVDAWTLGRLGAGTDDRNTQIQRFQAVARNDIGDSF